MKKSFITKEQTPLVLQPIGVAPSFEEFIAYLKAEKQELGKLVIKHGGILFRGFPIDGAKGFNAAIEALGFGEMLNYVGGDSPRDRVSGKVYTSTEAPPSFKILLHNEMSFIKHYPKNIYFYCDTPAPVGGATILADARSIYQAMPQHIRTKFEGGGLRYVSNYYGKNMLFELINRLQRGHKSWMEAFETDDKEAVEKMCKENEFGYKWHGSWLEIMQDCPATIKHKITDEPIWFNQAHLYDFNARHIGYWNWIGTKIVYSKPHTIMHEIFYGDGSPIAKKDLYTIMDVLDQQTISYPWQKRDFLVLDNVLMMHGRAPFSGKRKTLTALTR